MTAGAKALLGAVPSDWPGVSGPGPDSGATVLSAVSMPLPSDVALCGSRRSMVASSAAPSSVGGCTTSPPSPNATTPTLAWSGRRSISVLAASLATSIRVGSTSSAAMLDDTSSASMTVPSWRGTGNVSCGRAVATASSATAIRNTTGATWRHRPASVGASSPVTPIAPRLAASRLRLRCRRAYT